MIPALKLHDGHTVPCLGFGVWKASSGDCYNAVRTALDTGYRHIDTARIYGNEEDVGRAIRDSGIPRNDIFVTTKLWNSDQAKAQKAFDDSLARLGLDYYLKFMALVSISLGVLNLLPIPVLDGGHLMYHMIEVVRGRPLSERAMEIAQQFGLSILFVLMAFAFFNDMNRLFSG